MRFTINREEFLKGLTIASKAVNKKSPNPSLKNFKLELNENGLFITGSSGELSLQTLVPYKFGDLEIIRNYKEGVVLINADTLTNVVRKMETPEIVFDEIDLTATISDQYGKANIQCVRVEEFPEIDLSFDGVQLNLSKYDFSQMVKQTAFAASVKEIGREILTALHLEASNGVLSAIATDASRMAKKQLKIPMDIEFSTNIPARIITEIDALTETSENITMCVSDKKVLFSFDRTLVATTLISGDYPDTQNVVPRITNFTLEVKTKDIIKAIDRVNVMSLDRENLVDLTMSSDGVLVTAKSSQMGSSEVNIELFKFTGEPLKIIFNSEYILAALRVLGGEDVVFSFVSGVKPFVLRSPSDDTITQIVTPVRSY